MTGHILTECEICDAPLGAHNLTGLCAECKLIARNERLTDNPERTTHLDVAAELGVDLRPGLKRACDDAVRNLGDGGDK